MLKDKRILEIAKMLQGKKISEKGSVEVTNKGDLNMFLETLMPLVSRHIKKPQRGSKYVLVCVSTGDYVVLNDTSITSFITPLGKSFVEEVLDGGSEELLEDASMGSFDEYSHTELVDLYELEDLKRGLSDEEVEEYEVSKDVYYDMLVGAFVKECGYGFDEGLLQLLLSDFDEKYFLFHSPEGFNIDTEEEEYKVLYQNKVLSEEVSLGVFTVLKDC